MAILPSKLVCGSTAAVANRNATQIDTELACTIAYQITPLNGKLQGMKMFRRHVAPAINTYDRGE